MLWMKGNPAYQDEVWEELLNGKIVAMYPRPGINHCLSASNIYYCFRVYLNCHGYRDEVVAFGTDLYLSEHDRFIPDMMIVCDRDKIKSDGVHGAPDLVVEVLSPSTASRDRGYKKTLYAKCGVREYWIVSPTEKSLEVYRLDGSDLALYDVYSVYPDWMLKKMKADERAAVVTQFQCSLYDDLDISLDDIFSGLVP